MRRRWSGEQGSPRASWHKTKGCGASPARQSAMSLGSDPFPSCPGVETREPHGRRAIQTFSSRTRTPPEKTQRAQTRLVLAAGD